MADFYNVFKVLAYKLSEVAAIAKLSEDLNILL
jgi:hypothetical protein